MSSSELSPFELPGFTLPLNYKPEGEDVLFANALDCDDFLDERFSNLDTYREILMVRVMNTITDKPNWDRKVFDRDITLTWREEISRGGEDVSPKMMDWIIEELQWKAGQFQEDGFVTAFDVGVVKSDVAISGQLQHDLKRAVACFENTPDGQKDYHPGSDNKVVNLVHPSLFPVIYGRTRILHDRTIDLGDCLLYAGQGEVLPVPPEEETEFVGESSSLNLRSVQASHLPPYPFSRKFQWLPCDVQFTDEDPGCRIVSYINNMHPLEHRALYEAVERIIARAIPLWNRSLAEPLFSSACRRISYLSTEFNPPPEPKPEPRREDGQDSDSDEFKDRLTEWDKSFLIQLPEPRKFSAEDVDIEVRVDLRDRFREDGLQVIVKLANIELTPEKPEYEGGTWLIEGQLNERICATANYYYDCENVTQSTLSFRQRADAEYARDIIFSPDEDKVLYEVFGFDPEEVQNREESQITQELGSVMCQEGRLLTFPNVVQHRVSPFSLVDRSKPGHQKVVALFLVDPGRRIISSANVPPQRDDWGRHKQEFVSELLLRWMPRELGDMVSKDIIESPITMDEAEGYRLELIEERAASSMESNEAFETGEFRLG